MDSADGRLTNALLPAGWPLERPGALSATRSVPPVMETALLCWRRFITSVPACTVVPPVKVLLPLSVTVPAVDLVRADAPTMAGLMVPLCTARVLAATVPVVALIVPAVRVRLVADRLLPLRLIVPELVTLVTL